MAFELGILYMKKLATIVYILFYTYITSSKNLQSFDKIYSNATIIFKYI